MSAGKPAMIVVDVALTIVSNPLLSATCSGARRGARRRRSGCLRDSAPGPRGQITVSAVAMHAAVAVVSRTPTTAGCFKSFRYFLRPALRFLPPPFLAAFLGAFLGAFLAA